MMGSSIVWRMAISNLLKQWKQTLLAIVAGSIGAMLIALSVVNYTSVQKSGEEWLDTRLGSINWQLKPSNLESKGFTQAEVDKLIQTTVSTNPEYRILPYVKTEAAVVVEQALNSLLLIGFPLEAAAQLDPAREKLWRAGLGADELIVNSSTAKLLDVRVGDAVSVLTSRGDKLLRIRSIVDESGLTGFRDTGAYNGTLIAAEATVRELAGMDAEVYPAILVGHTDANANPRAMFLAGEIGYTIQYLKEDYKYKLDQMNFTPIIGLISAIAIVTSMLFMRQLLIMIGESRQTMYGILRALGMTEKHIFSMLAAEVLILSLLTAIVGTVLGIVGGYALIGYFFGSFSDELARMSGIHIPIRAHVSFGSTVTVFFALLLFTSVISLLAARRAGKMKIVEAIKGGGPTFFHRNIRRRSVGFKLSLSIGTACSIAFLSMVLLDPPDLNQVGEDIPLIILLWLVTCFTVLFYALYLVSLVDKPIAALLQRLGIPRLSIMMAVKYPRQHGGRTYISGLLFTLVMMLLVIIITIQSALQVFNDVDRNSQTVFGYEGYAAYTSVEERDHILRTIEEDDFLKEHLHATSYVEPYMLLLDETGKYQSSVVSVNDAIVQGVHLIDRAPQFDSDEAALRAVMSDPNYIILPYEFVDEDSYQYWDAMADLRAGEEITLKIYENGIRLRNQSLNEGANRSFIIAGFAEEDANERLVEHFTSIFVHPSIAAQLKPFGFKWPNHLHLGYVLFQFDYKDVRLAQMIEERLLINGVLSFEVPYLNNSASLFVMKQAGNGFIGFTILSAVIGLMGLTIIQYRAVKERGNHIAMMRCIGISGKQIVWMYVLEGFIVSVIGLLVGWGIGTAGMHIFLHTVTNDVASNQEPLQLGYPYYVIVPIVIGLALASLLLNIIPAKAALKLKPAIALRRSSD